VGGAAEGRGEVGVADEVGGAGAEVIDLAAAVREDVKEAGLWSVALVVAGEGEAPLFHYAVAMGDGRRAPDRFGRARP